jgi:hypothetical protein
MYEQLNRQIKQNHAGRVAAGENTLQVQIKWSYQCHYIHSGVLLSLIATLSNLRSHLLDSSRSSFHLGSTFFKK